MDVFFFLFFGYVGLFLKYFFPKYLGRNNDVLAGVQLLEASQVHRLVK